MAELAHMDANCETPLGFETDFGFHTQGAPLVRRPWAMVYNAFGVGGRRGRRGKGAGLEIHAEGVGQRSLGSRRAPWVRM